MSLGGGVGVMNQGRIAYSVAEACELTSLGRSKIYALISEGKLVTRKVGKRTLILASSLWELVDLPWKISED